MGEKVMKVCIVQPPYSTDFSQSEKYFKWEMEAFDRCDESMDLIVFPEATDIPCMAHSAEDVIESYEKYFDRLYTKACETAKRCNAVLFFNAHDKTEKGLEIRKGIALNKLLSCFLSVSGICYNLLYYAFCKRNV